MNIKQLIPVTLMLTSLLAGSVERRVLERIQDRLNRDGRVIFSTLYNDSSLSPEERAFLGRLYEVAFALPVFLRDQYEHASEIPSNHTIARHFGIDEQSVAVLLDVLEADPRVPRLYTRNEETGDINSLNLPNIERFVRQKGGEVRMTQWVGKPVPRFQVRTLDNRLVTNEQLRGHNSLLYFWFTGCPPCMKMAPILSELARNYEPTGFVFYSLNADAILGIATPEESYSTHLGQQEGRFVQAILNTETKEAFGNVNVYPTLFFVNKDGLISAHFVNLQDRDTLVAVIERMLE